MAKTASVVLGEIDTTRGDDGEPPRFAQAAKAVSSVASALRRPIRGRLTRVSVQAEGGPSGGGSQRARAASRC
jgi:hypothetical protein